MAPEHLGGAVQSVDARADVFALGSILCEILTGRPAYVGTSPRKARHQPVEADLAEALSRLEGCGAEDELVGLARDCLAADPGRRPNEAGELARRLTAYLDGVGERLRHAELGRVEAQARADEETKRRRLTALLAFLAVSSIVLVAIGSLEWLRRRQEREAVAARVFREVEVLRDKATSDPMGDPSQWRTALDALQRAGLLLADAPQATREHVLGLTTELERGLNRAEGDRRLLDRLEPARSYANEGDLTMADDQFATAFRDAGLDVEARDSFAIGQAVVSRPREVKDEIVAFLDCWAIVRRERQAKGEKDVGSSRRPFVAARAADPDPWRNRLRDAVGLGDHEALVRLSTADGLEGRPAPSLWLLGRALIGAGEFERAAVVLRRAWRSRPGDFWINLDLSHTLAWSRPPELEEGARYATAAVAARPESAAAHMGLAIFLQRRGDRTGAEAEFRKALGFRPDDALGRYNLANLLADQQRTAEAVEQYRAAIRLHLRQAYHVRTNLGNALLRLGRLEEAAVELREVIKERPELLPPWATLGLVQLQQGEGAAAAESFRRAAALARSGSSEATQIAALLSQSMLLIRLPAVLRGEDRPGNNAERLVLAKLCGERGHAAAGARLYADALDADPSLAGDRSARHREHAARLAIRAGIEGPSGGPLLDATERSRLRRQALDWFRAELAAWTHPLPSGSSEARRAAIDALQAWKQADVLAGVRDPKALAALSKDEHDAWQSFWRDVEVWLER